MKKMGIAALTAWNSLAELEPSKVETTGMLSRVNCAPLVARVWILDIIWSACQGPAEAKSKERKSLKPCWFAAEMAFWI
jgi:hypothetical protein